MAGWDLHPLEKHRLITAHTHCGHLVIRKLGVSHIEDRTVAIESRNGALSPAMLRRGTDALREACAKSTTRAAAHHIGGSTAYRVYGGGRESNMTLSEFHSQLDKLLPSPISRPFLCDGSPLECRIFIVGTNSAREVEKPFSRFWSDSRGFKKAEFIRELEQLPRGLTKTRKNIEIVACAAGQAVTLDTNIYLQPTPTEAELRKENKNTDLIEYLLKSIRPKVVLAHGVKAKKFFRKRCRDFVDDSVAPQKITWDAWQWQFRLLCSPHLSFRTRTNQAAAEEAERIGQALAAALRLTTPTR